MMGANRALAITLYFFGDFEAARQYAVRSIQIWRSGGVHSPVEEITAPAVSCLCCKAQSEWHLGEITSCQATIAEAISPPEQLNDMHALAVALWNTAILALYERNPAEVERCASKKQACADAGSFSDFPALNLFTDRKVSGERIGNGRIPERVIFYSDSMRAVSRLAINHTLTPERRLNSRYVVIDAQEHRLDAETLDVIGSDQWLPSAKLSSIHSVHFVTLGHETTKPLSSIARQIFAIDRICPLIGRFPWDY